MRTRHKEVRAWDSASEPGAERRWRRSPPSTAVGLVGTAVAALQGNENAKKPKVLIGADNDDTSNTTIQPPGVTANQSLRKSDQIFGGKASDTIIGRLGSDVLLANAGDDVMVGGTEGGQPALPAGQLPDNNDIAYGGVGSDSFIWAPGDGSDAFIGGNPAKVKKKVKGKKSAAKGKKKAKPVPEIDTLVVGNLVLSSDLTCRSCSTPSSDSCRACSRLTGVCPPRSEARRPVTRT